MRGKDRKSRRVRGEGKADREGETERWKDGEKTDKETLIEKELGWEPVEGSGCRAEFMFSLTTQASLE